MKKSIVISEESKKINRNFSKLKRFIKSKEIISEASDNEDLVIKDDDSSILNNFENTNIKKNDKYKDKEIKQFDIEKEEKENLDLKVFKKENIIEYSYEEVRIFNHKNTKQNSIINPLGNKSSPRLSVNSNKFKTVLTKKISSPIKLKGSKKKDIIKKFLRKSTVQNFTKHNTKIDEDLSNNNLIKINIDKDIKQRVKHTLTSKEKNQLMRANNKEFSKNEIKINRVSSVFMQNLLKSAENKYKTPEERFIIEISKKKIDNHLKLTSLFFSEQRDVKEILSFLYKMQGFLKFIKFFNIEDDVLKDLSQVITYKYIKKGNYIFRQGDETHAMYGIIEGRVLISEVNYVKKTKEVNISKNMRSINKFISNKLLKILLKQTDLKALNEKEKAILSYGDIFGEQTLINNLPHDCSASVLEDSKLFIIDRHSYNKLLSKAIHRSEQDKKIKIFDHFIPFQLVSKKKFDEIFNSISIRYCKNGEVIYNENTDANNIYFIYQGNCNLYKRININQTIPNEKLNNKEITINISESDSLGEDKEDNKTINSNSLHESERDINSFRRSSKNTQRKQSASLTATILPSTFLKKKYFGTHMHKQKKSKFMRRNSSVIRKFKLPNGELINPTHYFTFGKIKNTEIIDNIQIYNNILVLKYISPSIAGLEALTNLLYKNKTKYKSTLVSTNEFTVVMVLTQNILRDLFIVGEEFYKKLLLKHESFVNNSYKNAIKMRENLKITYSTQTFKNNLASLDQNILHINKLSKMNKFSFLKILNKEELSKYSKIKENKILPKLNNKINRIVTLSNKSHNDKNNQNTRYGRNLIKITGNLLNKLSYLSNDSSLLKNVQLTNTNNTYDNKSNTIIQTINFLKNNISLKNNDCNKAEKMNLREINKSYNLTNNSKSEYEFSLKYQNKKGYNTIEPKASNIKYKHFIPNNISMNIIDWKKYKLGNSSLYNSGSISIPLINN